MQCPNCGRTVRSKTQCAFCGHKFDGTESKHVHKEVDHSQTPDLDESPVSREGRSQNDYVAPVAPLDQTDDLDDFIEANEVIPRTRRSGGFLRVLWAILKLAIVVFLVFLLIAFGPRYFGQLMDKFNSGQNPLTAFFNQETTTEEVTTIETTILETTVEETTQALASNLQANTDAFPLTELSFEITDSNVTVDRDKLEVGVASNGQETLITDYALMQEGNKYIVSFNNPALGVVAVDQAEQTVFVRSAELGIDASTVVTLPNLNVDAETFDTYNQVLTEELAGQGDLSAVFMKADESVPFVYENQSKDASQTFAWFIIARTYAAIEAGDLKLEDEVTILDALKAANDPGLVATNEEGTVYTVEELLTEMVQNQDVTAMNHLIQATGGPNAFNLWLTENHYFSTKVNELLGTNEEGAVTGTVTSAQDLATLLQKFANNELVSADLDEQIKTLLLGTPLTAKYPEGVTGVVRRYEIASDDLDTSNQSYAGILETEDSAYIFVSLLDNVSDAEASVTATSQGLGRLVSFAETGEAVFDEVTTEETTIEETTIEETVAAEVVTQAPPVYEETTAASRFTYGEDTDGDGYPNTVYDPNWGSYRAIRWTQHADGLYYFEYAE